MDDRDIARAVCRVARDILPGWWREWYPDNDADNVFGTEVEGCRFTLIRWGHTWTGTAERNGEELVRFEITYATAFDVLGEEVIRQVAEQLRERTRRALDEPADVFDDGGDADG